MYSIGFIFVVCLDSESTDKVPILADSGHRFVTTFSLILKFSKENISASL